MTLVDKVLNRRNIRRYKQTAIPPEVLQAILEAGQQAHQRLIVNRFE